METKALLFLTPEAAKKFESLDLPPLHAKNHYFFFVREITFEGYGLWIETDIYRRGGAGEIQRGKIYVQYSDILTIWDRKGYTKETEPEKVFGFRLSKVRKKK